MTTKNIFIFLTLLFLSFSVKSQVDSVLFQLEFVDSTGLYNFNLYIQQGSATTIPHRAQFNSQYSIVFPDDLDLTLIEELMPLKNNHNYDGTVPTDYTVGTGVDYQGLTYKPIYPLLNTTSFYNDVFAGDFITLFTFDMGGYHQDIRLYENGVDPDANEMPDSGDYSNGFTMGGANQLYNGNLPTIFEEDAMLSLDESFSSANRPFFIGDLLGEPNGSAILELESTTKGFLMPRMTHEEMLSIENPAEGLVIYSTTEKIPHYYNGKYWSTFDGKSTEIKVGSMAYGGIVVNISKEGEVLVLDTSLVQNLQNVSWGCEGTNITETESIVGPYNLGDINSNLILQNCSTSGTAADIVSNLSITQNEEQFDDWHLPSVNDYLKIQNLNISNEYLSTDFWLAHQEDSNNAIISADHIFGKTITSDAPKSSLNTVYAVRTFLLP